MFRLNRTNGLTRVQISTIIIIVIIIFYISMDKLFANDNSFEKREFLRAEEVIKIIPMKRTTWYNGVKSGKFPKAYKIGRSCFWDVKDIDKLVQDIKNRVLNDD